MSRSPSTRAKTAQGAEIALKALAESADALGPLKSAAGGALALVNLIKNFKRNRKDWEALENDVAQGIATVQKQCETVHRAPGFTPKRQSTLESQFADLEHALSEVNQEVRSLEGTRSRFTKFLAVNDDRDKIEEFRGLVRQAFHKFEFQSMAAMHREAESRKERELVDSIPHLSGAAYNGSLHTELRACLPGTRTNLLEHIHAWIDSTTLPRILCLTGLAGTGKSTIAYTLASQHDPFNTLLGDAQAQGSHILGASFFFSSASTAAGDGSQFFSSLVYQLSRRDPSIRAAVVANPEAVREASSANFRVQYQQLLCAPLLAIQRTEPSFVVIVVDSLDLCASDMRKGILELLIDLSLRVTFVKILLTTRRDHETRDLLLSASRRGAVAVYEMPRDIADGDVARFLSHSLVVPEDGEAPQWTPQDLHVHDLAERSAGLFIFAAVAVRYIIGSALDGSTPATRLGALLEATNPLELDADDRSNPYSVLDRLYHQVLSLVPTSAVPTLAVALQFLCVRLEPLTISSMERLLRDSLRKGASVRRTLTTVEALLSVPVDDGLITLIHPSLLDYLTTPERCLDGRVLVKPAEAHALLAGACMSMMREALHRGQNDGRGTSGPLGYACRFWVSHLTAAGAAVPASGSDELRLFCREKLLAWMEWMTAHSELSRALSCLQAAILWCQDAARRSEMRLETALLDDARRMLLSFWEPISEDPQQIYRSALPFLPRSSPIRHQYASEQQPVTILQGLPEAWGPCDRTIATQCAEITSVAFSNDGERLASASRDGTVKLWDSTDGSCQAIFSAHAGACAAVQFISNGKSILSAGGEGDCRIVIRDLKSQEASCTIQDETRCIVAAVWYETSEGEFVASAAVEGEIRLWNTRSLQCVATLRGHADTVTSIAIGGSSRSPLLCSCSDDRSVMLWNLVTLQRTCTVRLDSACLCVTFSPDELSLACGTHSGSITCWDITESNLHEKWTSRAEYPVVSLCFIDDSKRLAAGRESTPLVQVLSSDSGETVAASLSGHIYGVHSLAYSPRKQLLVSGSSDQTLCIYPTKAFASQETLFTSRRPRYITVSASGMLAAVGYRCGSVALHDLRREQETLCSGHRAAITALAFCSSDTCVLSSSEDCEIRAWMLTGACLRTFAAHTAEVTCLSTSPTGPLFVTGSHDRTVRLWDTQVENAVCSFSGHTKSVHAVAIREGDVASASGDCTVRLWSSEHRRSTRVLLGHSHAVGAVAFSLDGACVASGSDSGDVIVWETNGGSILFQGNLDAYTSTPADIRMHSVQFVKHDTALAVVLDDGSSVLFDAVISSPNAAAEDYGSLFTPESFDFAWLVNILAGDGSRRLLWLPNAVRCDSYLIASRGNMVYIASRHGCMIVARFEDFAQIAPV